MLVSFLAARGQTSVGKQVTLSGEALEINLQREWRPEVGLARGCTLGLLHSSSIQSR
jgi:hypothetical protein